MNDPLSRLWTAQQHDAVAPAPADLARADARLRRRIWRRDAVEYAAGLLAAAIFTRTALVVPDWGIRIACAATILGVGVTLFNLWQRRPGPPPPEVPSLDYHRAELARQRDMLASVGRWYIAPILPGLILFLLAIGHAASARMPAGAVAATVAIGAVPAAAVLWGIQRLNQVAARRLQRRIDALDEDASSHPTWV